MGEMTMREVVQLLGIDCDYTRSSVNIHCPSSRCTGDRASVKKLNINFDNNDGCGSFRCPKCSFEGGPLKFWSFYRNLPDDDFKAVARDFHNFKSGSSKAVTSNFINHIPEKVEVETAPIETRHKTYSTLLNILTLSDKHREDLLNRGLNDLDINTKEYKSYPLIEKTTICNLLMQNGCILSGVPGFYKDEENRWTMMCAGSGFLIPQRNGKGQIQSLQIRQDKSEIAKYLTFSTPNKYCGSRSKANCHYVNGSLDNKELILTEGPLKGDIISYFSGYSVLALQGVNNLKAARYALADLYNANKFTKVLIAFDMDLYDNPNVEDALNRLKETLIEFEIPFSTLTWDKEFKGLDDWLYANLRR